MSELSKVYGNAIYSAADGAGLTERIYSEMESLAECFKEEPRFLKILSTVGIPKEERFSLIDDCLSGRVHPFLVNFMKILTERSLAGHFSECMNAYKERYFLENGIMPVSVVSAVPLNDDRAERLKQKLAAITGKKIILSCSVDPSCIGGLKVSYDSKQIDGTVSHRLSEIAGILKAES